MLQPNLYVLLQYISKPYFLAVQCYFPLMQRCIDCPNYFRIFYAAIFQRIGYWVTTLAMRVQILLAAPLSQQFYTQEPYFKVKTLTQFLLNKTRYVHSTFYTVIVQRTGRKLAELKMRVRILLTVPLK